MAIDWFQIVKGRELQQGDVLFDCPTYSLPLVHGPKDGEKVDATIQTLDQIILSQSCDLVEGQEKITEVVLCAIPTLKEAQETPAHSLSKKDNRKKLVKYQLVNFHPLKAFESEKLKRPMSVVQFSMVSTLPVSYVREFAESQGERLRLASPFREHLAQRFGFFFGRIGLPEELALPVD